MTIMKETNMKEIKLNINQSNKTIKIMLNDDGTYTDITNNPILTIEEKFIVNDTNQILIDGKLYSPQEPKFFNTPEHQFSKKMNGASIQVNPTGDLDDCKEVLTQEPRIRCPQTEKRAIDTGEFDEEDGPTRQKQKNLHNYLFPDNRLQ